MARRLPLLFCGALTGALVLLTLLSRWLLPSFVVGDVGDLDPAALEPPTPLEQALTTLGTSENLFWFGATLLGLALLAVVFLPREAGLGNAGRRLHLAVFPLLVAALYLSGGFYVPGVAVLAATAAGVVVAVLGEELLFRGHMFSALRPSGPFRTVALTAVFAGSLGLIRAVTSGPWPEAVFVTLLTVGGGFAYGALRWRTGSLLPPIVVHLALALARDVSAPGERVYQLLLVLTSIGFVVYGLVLLRGARGDEDGA